MRNARIVRFRAAESPELMAQAWRLRHRVFRESLGWDVTSVDLLEFDGFDRSAWHCGVVSGDRMLGYMRALRTVDPYLLELSFPVLLEGRPAPKSPRIWEISRFAVLPGEPNRHAIGRMLVREVAAFGQDMGADRMIAVTEPIFERFLKQCGMAIERIAGPTLVGTGHGGDIKATLISFDISSNNLAALGIGACAA